jgi:phage recombination protein Bet
MPETLTLAAPPAVSTDQLDLVKRTVANGATDAELKLFLFDCARQGVHPLDRLLHFTKRKGKYVPITSIDLMRTRAADTGEYAGSDDATFEYDATDDSGRVPARARVTVWRLVQHVRSPFTASARWDEYCPPSGNDQDLMWRKMPHTMLAKCAEALALRKGFPRQLAGLYAAEELEQAGEDDAPPSAPPPPARPAPVTSPVTQPSPTAADLAEAAVLITKVDLPWAGQKGNAKAFLFHSGQPPGRDHGLPIYDSKIKELAEACRDARTPVILAIAASKATGSLYVKSIQPLADVARAAAAPSETGDPPPPDADPDAPPF